eukprot:gene44116-58835_t
MLTRYYPNFPRNISSISTDVASALLPDSNNACSMVCLDKGMPRDLMAFSAPSSIYNGKESIEKWFKNSCLYAHMGMRSYLENSVTVYWLNGMEERVEIGILRSSDTSGLWQNVVLGHVFEAVDSITKEVLGTYTITYNIFIVLGMPTSSVQDLPYVDTSIKKVLDIEYQRSRRVTRTFTEFGFGKGRLPNDVLASIMTYYYNNRHHMVREDWYGKGFFVNWWEKDAFMIDVPGPLKAFWQNRLRELAEKWIGGNVELENTSIYGIRRYENGARLLSHVDRESTHAVSMIINVDQSVRKPWLLEIYDHADRLHEVEMAPGDVVYYESARCLHGRMTPLDGDYFVNIFTHYRPVGDPEWFLKPNPPGTP